MRDDFALQKTLDMVKCTEQAYPAWQRTRKFQTPRKKSRMGIFTAFAMRSSASMEMIFSPRSISPRYFGFKFTASASFSWVRPAFLRYVRMASPIIFRCRNIAFFFGLATPKDCRYQLIAYTSNMLVFLIVLFRATVKMR